ncbi:MAG: phosphoribosylanthranilate isomerase [Candidatus Bathyarchaeota archaeon]|nr:phosphoribosylanthranilate isomerase [Candidatus Termiticorpusculum sp.]
MIKVKICGLTRLQDIDAVNIERPDYIGFVFANSSRKVSSRQALELRARLVQGITPIGVFVNETIEDIVSLIQDGIVDVVQLHGGEDEEYIKRLKKLTEKPIIKAVTVQKAGDVQKWASTSADYLLLDNKGGGTGQTFDWSLIGETDSRYFLAGGLNIENVGAAIEKTNPYAVDISSGVETGGVKDPLKIKEFIRRIRNTREFL